MIFQRLRNLWKLGGYTLADEDKKGVNPYLVKDTRTEPPEEKRMAKIIQINRNFDENN